MSTGVIVILVIAIVLLVVQMVLSALAASEIRKGQGATGQTATDYFNKAHTYSTAAAVTAALCAVGLVVAMILYINSQRILTAAHARLGQAVASYATPVEVHAAAGQAIAAAS